MYCQFVRSTGENMRHKLRRPTSRPAPPTAQSAPANAQLMPANTEWKRSGCNDRGICGALTRRFTDTMTHSTATMNTVRTRCQDLPPSVELIRRVREG